MILDPTVLACCDRCSVTEEIAMDAVSAEGTWAVPNVAVRLMALGWLLVGLSAYCPECRDRL